MRTGLIIGKFMPLTKGHIGLIEFGLENCDKLIIAVCSLKSEPIEGDLRFYWVKKHFCNNVKVEVTHITTEDLPNSSVSSRYISKIWAEYLKELYPEVVKLFYVKTVCIYGSDSCGKSTLTMDLAKHYKTAFVPEVARNMFEWGDLSFDNLNINHLEQFAKLQYEAVNSMKYFANKILICDSDNITTQIYSQVYCGHVTEKIKKYELPYDLFLDIDTPYIEEGQRNLINRRKEMRKRFMQELDYRAIRYVLISGSWEERFNQAVKAIEGVVSAT